MKIINHWREEMIKVQIKQPVLKYWKLFKSVNESYRDGLISRNRYLIEFAIARKMAGLNQW